MDMSSFHFPWNGEPFLWGMAASCVRRFKEFGPSRLSQLKFSRPRVRSAFDGSSGKISLWTQQPAKLTADTKGHDEIARVSRLSSGLKRWPLEIHFQPKAAYTLIHKESGFTLQMKGW